MKSTACCFFAGLLLGVSALGVAGCSANARKERHLSAARDYVASGAYEKAEIEYMNVLQVDAQNPDAIAGLGLLYFDQGRLSRVFSFLNEAKNLQPNNFAVRDRLASLYQGAGKFTEARTEALYVLEHKPDDGEAPLVLAGSAQKPEDILDAKNRLQHLPNNAGKGAPALTALGVLEVKQRALPNAESDFDQARKADPKYSAAYLGLASIYRARGETEKAEQAFSTAASLSPIRSGTRIQYAQFELQTGHVDVAKRVLNEMIEKAPDCLPPQLALAEIDVSEQKYDEALALCGKVLARDANHPDALALTGRILLAKGDTAKALSTLDRAVALYPESASLNYQLGVAASAAGDVSKALTALNEALRLAPGNAPATLALAELEIRQGNFNSSIARLKKLLQQHPELPQARLALATAFTRQGNLNDALAIYQQLDKAYPRNPQTSLLIGTVLALAGKNNEAKSAFEHALELAPDFLPALQQLVDLELKSKDFTAARDRVQAYAAKNPTAAAPHVLLAQISLNQGDNAAAKVELNKAISLQPDQVVPYMLLARLYIAGGDSEKAISSLDQAAKNSPKSPEPLMMMAVIRDQQKQYSQARDYYEKVLALNPKFSAALNNLAYLYSEFLNDSNRAFDLAQRARELLPGEPHTADTLGWILYKRGQYPWALSLLSESAERLPTSEDVQFHLGMAQYRLGNETAARTALTEALKLNPTFSGAAEANKALSVLAIDPGRATQQEVTALEHSTESSPDPVALAKLGAWYARHGSNPKALDAYERAVKASPNDVEAALGLINVYRAMNQNDKALDLAKATRKLAPGDSALAQTLGELALSSGDVGWSFSLLQEAVRNKPNDPSLLFSFAKAAYGTGRTAAAQDALGKALQAGPDFARASEARDWADMIELAQNDTKAAQSSGRIQQVLASRPKDPAALVAMAAAKLSQHDPAAAIAACDTALKEEPDFAPATRQLAIAFAGQAANDSRAADIATKARDAYPTDPQVARALGIILYRQGNYQRAATLLGETSRTLPSDGTVFYYLGLAQRQMKDITSATQSLKRALAAGLDGDLAADARRILASK